MTHDEVKENLAHLRTAAARLEPEDTEARAELAQLIARLERRLEASEIQDDEDVLMDSLSISIERFEATHPKLTLLLNQIMAKLSGMGI